LLLSSVPRLGISQHLTGISGTAPPPGARPSACFFAPRCPIATDRCVVEYPPAFNIGPGHAASCWRALELSVRTGVESVRVSRAGISDDLLALENVFASYERGGGRAAVLHDISFSVHSGECVALVGETGSGKSTIGRCIAGLHRPDNGSIRLRGEPLASHASKRRAVQQRAVQIVFQNPDRSLNPSHNVATSIARPLRLYGLADSRTVRRRVTELCERVQLSASILDRYPRELSGGQKQRVAIARALAAGPEVLVCDEITSALDVSIQATVINLLQDIKQDGLSLLFITHNLPLVSSIADRVVVLEGGVIKEEGETSRVIRTPIDEYTRALLAATPKIGVAL
jgi:peptide/nickel transport system ATP-binding protein